MEPSFLELNTKLNLSKEIIVDGKTHQSLTLKRLIKRPLLKRIVFMTDEMDRVILYEGETDYETHKEDSEQTLISALKSHVETHFSKE